MNRCGPLIFFDGPGEFLLRGSKSPGEHRVFDDVILRHAKTCQHADETRLI